MSDLIVDTKYGKFHCYPGDLITNQLVQYSAHTRNELAMVLDHISQGDIVLDIGAHIGTYSIPIAKKVSNGKVYSIEANPANYNLLSKNIAENKLHNKIAPANILLADESGNNYSGISREANSGGFFYIDSILKYGSQESYALSSFLKTNNIFHIDFIKIDIEGMEHLVLSDIKSILESCRPILYVEVCDEHLRRHGSSTLLLMSFLESLGYQFFHNTYLRNSGEDKYIKEELSRESYSEFFDVLAIHYP